jgi:hypothetical protein
MAPDGILIEVEFASQSFERSTTSAQQLDPPSVIVAADLAPWAGDSFHGTICATKKYRTQT